MNHGGNTFGRAAAALALAATLAIPAAVAADDVAWVFTGSTNRVAVATASASNASTLLTTLDNGFVASSNSITMSTCPPRTLIMVR